jgi:chromosomal replication initiator protein
VILDAITTARLAVMVETACDLPLGSIRGKSRCREVAWPRQALMLALRTERRMSYPEIGRRLGKRDHTTVLHGCREAEKRRVSDPDFAAIVTRFCDLARLPRDAFGGAE